MNLIYKNKGKDTIRNKLITDYLFQEISKAIELVYGEGAYAHIYSGGQSRDRRLGSVRHNDGKAADIHVYCASGNQIKGIHLGYLAQYWAAKKIGGVGIEMVGGGIHLDQWANPPKNGGMFWFYKNGTQSLVDRNEQVKQVAKGMKGEMPPLFPVGFNLFTTLFKIIGSLFNGKAKK